MLILTRKIGESVIINDETYVNVLGFERGYVRLSFEAPPEVKILRQELQERDESLSRLLVRPNVFYSKSNKFH